MRWGRIQGDRVIEALDSVGNRLDFIPLLSDFEKTGNEIKTVAQYRLCESYQDRGMDE